MSDGFCISIGNVVFRINIGNAVFSVSNQPSQCLRYGPDPPSTNLRHSLVRRLSACLHQMTGLCSRRQIMKSLPAGRYALNGVSSAPHPAKKSSSRGFPSCMMYFCIILLYAVSYCYMVYHNCSMLYHNCCMLYHILM